MGTVGIIVILSIVTMLNVININDLNVKVGDINSVKCVDEGLSYE